MTSRGVTVSLAWSLLLAASLLAMPRAASADVTPRVLGGRPAPAAEATVAPRNDAGQLVCSGVVVAPRLVLTAAHCLPLPSGDDSPGPRDACFGPRIDACTSTRAVVAHRLHPAWDPLTFRADLGMIVLADDAPVVPARLVADDPSSIDRGATFEVIGYGRTDAIAFESAGEKRSGLTQVTEIDEKGRIVHGEIACNGDSGGPLFSATAPDAVVAITSSGPVGCKTFGRATPVAYPANRAWIDAEIEAARPDADATTTNGGCSVGRRTASREHVFSPLAALAALSAVAWARSGSRRVARLRPPRRGVSSRS